MSAATWDVCTCTPGQRCLDADCDRCWRINGCEARDAAADMAAANDLHVQETLDALAGTPGVRLTVTVRWAACWCTDGAHHLLQRSDHTEHTGGQLAARRVRDRMGGHLLRYLDFTGTARQEVA